MHRDNRDWPTLSRLVSAKLPRILYLTPYLILHWRNLSTEAEAELAFQRRRAELRAEAEHADKQLAILDKKVDLVSLGFREVVRKVTPRVVNVINYREIRPGELELFGKRQIFTELGFMSTPNRQFSMIVCFSWKRVFCSCCRSVVGLSVAPNKY